MISIGEYTVVEPPTSRETYNSALDALRNNDGLMRLALQPDFEIPREAESSLTVRVLRTNHIGDPTMGAETVDSEDGQVHALTIYFGEDQDQPAKASVVR